MASFDEILKDCTKLGTKIPTSEYLENGKYPIIDQGQNDIAGYYDSDDGLFEDVPTIVFGDHTRVVKYVDKPCFLGADGVKLLCPVDKDINCKYLFYQLSCADIPNTGYNRHFKWVKALNFRIPSCDEQNHVVEVLDKVTELISLHKQQLAKLDELVKARFVEMFGDPINNPMKWIVSKIEDIAAQEKNALKAGPFGSALKKEFYVKSGYKIYGQEQVICGDASFGDYYIDEEKYKELKNYAVQAGDILISLVGTYGKTLIMPDNYEAGIINPRLMKITLNKNKVTPIYFKYYFESDALKASMDANTHGGTMGILNLGIIRQMKIQVPPLSIQNQFATFVERVAQQKQTVQQSLEKLELMKKALMQEYFG